MSDQLKIQGVVEMSAEGRKQPLMRWRKIRQMADRLQRRRIRLAQRLTKTSDWREQRREQFKVERQDGCDNQSLSRRLWNSSAKITSQRQIGSVEGSGRFS